MTPENTFGSILKSKRLRRLKIWNKYINLGSPLWLPVIIATFWRRVLLPGRSTELVSAPFDFLRRAFFSCSAAAVDTGRSLTQCYVTRRDYRIQRALADSVNAIPHFFSFTLPRKPTSWSLDIIRRARHPGKIRKQSEMPRNLEKVTFFKTMHIVPPFTTL